MSELEYWNRFYEKTSFPLPSQFGVYVAQEYFSGNDVVVDLGCGEGRDSILFLTTGLSVISIDQSDIAVARLAKFDVRINGHAMDISSFFSWGGLSKFRKLESQKVVFYARFVLHALENNELLGFMNSLSHFARVGNLVLLEFRTPEDDGLAKATSQHFRRGVAKSWVEDYLHTCGFDILESSEGQGFARFGSDNAFVARLAARKTRHVFEPEQLPRLVR